MKKVAVFIHTHYDSIKLRHLVDQLRGGKKYDLYISEDCTKHNIQLFDIPILKHSVPMFQQQGYCPVEHANYKWHMTDLPLYHCRDCLPDYDYYIQIDYDVHFSGRTPDYLDQLIEILLSENIDMCISDLTVKSSDWFWGNKFRSIYPDQDIIYGAFAAPVILSARAVDYLKNIRLAEAKFFQHGQLWDCYAFVEVFLATHMMNNPLFVCKDLNDVWPNSYVFETFNYSDTFFLEQDLGKKTELHHSVLDAENLMHKYINGAYKEGRPYELAKIQNSEYFTDQQKTRIYQAYTDLKNRMVN